MKSDLIWILQKLHGVTTSDRDLVFLMLLVGMTGILLLRKSEI